VHHTEEKLPSKISLKIYVQQKLTMTIDAAQNYADGVIQYILIGLQSTLNLSAKAADILERQGAIRIKLQGKTQNCCCNFDIMR